MPPEDSLSPVAPVAAPMRREAGAGYAAAARALSALPRLGAAEPPAEPSAYPGLDAALRQAGAEALLPGGAGGLALPLLLAALRPGAAGWLGETRLTALAAALELPEAEAAALLDTPPPPPAALGEPSRWAGRQVPLRDPGGAIAWMDLFWRPDGRHGPARDRHVLAARLSLPWAGRVEVRARLEEGRLDAVMETAGALPRAVAADLVEGFAALLLRLRLEGNLTLRHAGMQAGT